MPRLRAVAFVRLLDRVGVGEVDVPLGNRDQPLVVGGLLGMGAQMLEEGASLLVKATGPLDHARPDQGTGTKQPHDEERREP